MRKIYAFLAAALMSVSAFASADVVPSDAVLADYYNQGDVCVCFFVPADMNCNNIVLTGSFNGWKSNAAECVAVEPVEGYDGWYVGSFEPEAEPSEADGICAKPIMLDVDGNFNWEYQIGAATYIRGGVQVVQGAYAGEIETEPAWADDAYLQKNVEGQWVRYPGEEGDNTLTHEDANILYDLRAEDLRWARCDDSPLVTYTVAAKMPAENCPEAVEIIGGFDAWEGTAMTFNASTGYFEATVEAKAAQFFKFRGAGSWDQELEVYDAENDTWAKIGDNALVFGQLADDQNAVVLDFSDPELARWTVKEEGIENVVLTEKAHKVIVDGVLYIVRDNKMFNIQGAQVR